MKIILTLTLVLASCVVFAQNFPELKIENIPDSLLQDANCVIRNYSEKFEILADHRAVQTVKEVKTLLNKGADGEAMMYVYYDQFTKVRDFTAMVLDAKGNKLKRLKKSDIIDYSMSNKSIVDTRIMLADLTREEYPYTVIFEYEIVHNGLLVYPSFIPQSSYKVSVEKSKLEMIYPDNNKPRIKEMNIQTAENTDNKLVWKVSNLKANKRVPYSPRISEYLPYVLTAPTHFSYGGYKGDMDSWDGFGKWYNQLNSGRDTLSVATSEKINELVENIHSKEEKIKAVYQYMQSKTRYVSVQLGIGGFQTMLADKVDRDGWGDCKALTNYTKALLSEIGITSYPALVRAKANAMKVHEDFSSNQFNHVILCVPMAQDSIWLECTSRNRPFNFLSGFTDDRNVLLVHENSGTLVKTPRYDFEDNFIHTSAEVELDKDGNGSAKILSHYNGLEFSDLLNVFDESKEELEKIWYERLDIPSFEIDDIGFNYDKVNGPSASQHIELNLRKYASTGGKRFFFKPNMLNKVNTYPKKNDERTLQVATLYEYVNIDSIHYVLPEGYHMEFKPKDLDISSIFGEYSARYLLDENGFTYIRSIKRLKGKFPAESYNELSDFLKNVRKADNTKVVLVGST